MRIRPRVRDTTERWTGSKAWRSGTRCGVQLLNALADGKRVELPTFAKALDLPLAQVEYHCEALIAVGAVELDGHVALITAEGRELHRIAQRPERRQSPDRRQGDRRRR